MQYIYFCCILKVNRQLNKTVNNYFTYSRFGRKKGIVACLILAAFSTFGSVLITSEDNTSKGRTTQNSDTSVVVFLVTGYLILGAKLTRQQKVKQYNKPLRIYSYI